MKVVSLFDGMACGLEALKRIGANVTEYHAFEIDRYAITIAKKNHPEIIHHGSVVGADFTQFYGADLLIGGSPCQGFSFAGKQLAFDDPRSKLFFEYVRAREEINPHKFLLENVKMKAESLNVITQYMDVPPVFINSALVSAQNRQRYYWCNWPVAQPVDRRIFLKDIVEDKLEYEGGAIRGRYLPEGGTAQRLELNKLRKANALTTVAKDSVIKPREIIGISIMENGIRPFKNDGRKGSVGEIGLIAFPDAKHNALLTTKIPLVLTKNSEHEDVHFRQLTVIERERLQTVTDNYTYGVPDSQRQRMLGNGWTVEVIAHLFREGGLDLV